MAIRFRCRCGHRLTKYHLWAAIPPLARTQRESSVDPLAHMVKKLEKEKAADADGDGAGDDEWDD